MSPRERLKININEDITERWGRTRAGCCVAVKSRFFRTIRRFYGRLEVDVARTRTENHGRHVELAGAPALRACRRVDAEAVLVCVVPLDDGVGARAQHDDRAPRLLQHIHRRLGDEEGEVWKRSNIFIKRFPKQAQIQLFLQKASALLT